MKRFFADLFGVSREEYYKFDLELLNTQTQFNRYYKDKEKLTAALTSPALLKVIALQCDIFSMGKIYLKDSKGNYIENDPLLNFLDKPNVMQSQKQFLWDFMFWNMLGNSYLYIDSDKLNFQNHAYFLENYKIDFPTSLDLQKDKFIFSDAKLKEIQETIITYYYDDGTSFKFPMSKMIISNDLTNGVGNLYKGASRIDALYKIISNSEVALDAKNVNLRYSSKFMVGADSGADKLGLSKEEKDSIKNSMDKDGKKVYPMSALAKVQRFVSDMAKLELSKSFLDDYFLIGSMYNIPRDVLEAYNSSTYENQEKAIGRHISYSIEPKGQEFTNQIERYFGYDEKGYDLFMDWTHLPFMQVFEKERNESFKIKVDTMQSLINLGYTKEEAEKLVDL